MKTTIDIPDAVLRDAMAFTKARTKREAVVSILEEYLRRARMADLGRYGGTFSDSFPTNEEIEAMDAPGPALAAWRGYGQDLAQIEAEPPFQRQPAGRKLAPLKSHGARSHR
jgi:hypothetical protein